MILATFTLALLLLLLLMLQCQCYWPSYWAAAAAVGFVRAQSGDKPSDANALKRNYLWSHFTPP